MSPVNRRNYYRILHVQPDAPDAVIRMAYRTLMQKLRLHPDLGGDGATAALINEAYAVLSDPTRRAEYDARISLRPRRGAPSLTRHTVPKAPQAPPPAPPGKPLHCPFCTARVPPQAAEEAVLRCPVCTSPLSPPPPAKRLTAARRAFERQAVSAPVEYFVRGGSPAPRPAALRDFSPGGVWLTAAETVPTNTVLAIKAPLFDALARVLRCEPAKDVPGSWELRLEFLTLAVTAPTGSFVSTRA